MRVTTKMLASNYQRNLNKNLTSFSKIQSQLASGKNILKPSDDPYLATRIMDYETEIARKEQYERNINDVSEFADMTDTTLGQVTDQLNRINELTVKALNDSNSQEDLDVIAIEIDEIKESLVDTLNVSFQDKYVFGGTNTSQPPFELVQETILDEDGNVLYEPGDVKYNGNGEMTQVEIAKGVYVDRNTPGSDITNVVTKDNVTLNLFESINDISKALKSNDKEVLSELKPQMDAHIDNVLSQRGQVGALQNRMETTLDRTGEEILGLTGLLSKAADVDVPEKYIEYKTLEATYMASLQISSQIIQPSLLDFLR